MRAFGILQHFGITDSAIMNISWHISILYVEASFRMLLWNKCLFCLHIIIPSQYNTESVLFLNLIKELTQIFPQLFHSNFLQLFICVLRKSNTNHLSDVNEYIL
jgi:hypothetical protein